MTEANVTPETVKPSRFQLFKDKLHKMFDSGTDKVKNFFDRATQFKDKLVEKVTNTYHQVVEKAEPIRQRLEASRLHETTERFRGHVDTFRGTIEQIRLNTLFAESSNENLPEEIQATLTTAIEKQIENVTLCNLKATDHYSRANEIAQARQQIHESDLARIRQARERATNWFDTQGQAVRTRWEKLNLGTRFDRGRNNLADAISNFADIVRGRNNRIAATRTAIATG